MKTIAEIAPTPWRVSESVGGKTFMYDAIGQVIIVPNITQTGKDKEDLLTLYRHIVKAVNQLSDAEIRAAWEHFDKH